MNTNFTNFHKLNKDTEQKKATLRLCVKKINEHKFHKLALINIKIQNKKAALRLCVKKISEHKFHQLSPIE